MAIIPNNNEKMMTGNGYPALTYFEKGQQDKPLVIFVPGDSHLARISYGFSESKKEDFLAHWLVQKGYSFLGASYPTDNSVYKGAAYPAFTIQDWGKQVADLAKQVFEQNPELSKRIVVVGWSMGGSIAEPIAQAAKANGIAIDAFIALDAVPGNPYIMQSGPFSPSKQLENGYADRKPLYDWCRNAVIAQSKLNGHEVVSPETYERECLGNIPVDIEASEYRYQNGTFIKDPAGAIVDSGVFGRESNFPWIAMITSTDPQNSRISLTDQFEWARIQQFRISTQFPTENLSSEKYAQYQTLCNNLKQTLTKQVEGNHFFFLGEKGAKKTADQIDALVGVVKETEKQFQTIVNPPIE